MALSWTYAEEAESTLLIRNRKRHDRLNLYVFWLMAVRVMLMAVLTKKMAKLLFSSAIDEGKIRFNDSGNDFKVISDNRGRVFVFCFVFVLLLSILVVGNRRERSRSNTREGDGLTEDQCSAGGVGISSHEGLTADDLTGYL